MKACLWIGGWKLRSCQWQVHSWFEASVCSLSLTHWAASCGYPTHTPNGNHPFVCILKWLTDIPAFSHKVRSVILFCNTEKGRKLVIDITRKSSIDFIYRLSSLTLVRKTKSSFVNQNQIFYIGLPWPTFTDQFFRWSIWPIIIHTLSAVMFPLRLLIEVISAILVIGQGNG